MILFDEYLIKEVELLNGKRFLNSLFNKNEFSSFLLSKISLPAIGIVGFFNMYSVSKGQDGLMEGLILKNASYVMNAKGEEEIEEKIGCLLSSRSISHIFLETADLLTQEERKLISISVQEGK